MYNKETGIKEISFSVSEKEIHGLIGANGAGKTTIIKVILNFLDHDSGSITWKGNKINKNDSTYKKQIGYVPDDEVLLENLTPNEIIEFVGYAYGLTKSKINRSAQALYNLMQLEEVNLDVNGFSRGMRKKVQLVTALISNPELLILDEPIAGFDPNMIYLIKQLLMELREKEKGILISTHDLNFAKELGSRHSALDWVTLGSEPGVFRSGPCGTIKTDVRGLLG